MVIGLPDLDVLVTGAKFLQPSAYSTVINHAFHTINVFGWFGDVIVQFELIKQRLLI